MKKYIETGKIVTTHGLRGEFKVYPWCDAPEELTGYLRVAGFRNIQVYGDRKLRAPREDELRIWIAAEKE